MKYLISLAAILLLLNGCKSNQPQIEINADDYSIEELYDKGTESLKEEDYPAAAEYFEKILYKNPGHKLTPKSQVLQAYALYKNAEYEEAIDILEIFLKLNPRDQEAAYAHYLIALSYYVQIDDVKLDQSRAQNALIALRYVVNKFPNSKYASESKEKIKLVRDHLAGKEMFIGRHYLKKKNPIASIKRFQSVLKEYKDTAHREEALYRLVETNMMIGIPDEAMKYHEVLMKDYPMGEWLKRSKELIN